jgi:protein-tyrosine phosphatase
MIKVLFVCLGNICRSPVAEAIFKKRTIDAGLHHLFYADSAGTSDYHIGEPPDFRSATNAKQNGVLVEHHARQFTEEDFHEFHYILAMDQENLHHIQNMAHLGGIQHEGIFLFRSFQENREHLGVPDPYFGGPYGFQKVFDILDNCNSNFIEYLKERL